MHWSFFGLFYCARGRLTLLQWLELELAGECCPYAMQSELVWLAKGVSELPLGGFAMHKRCKFSESLSYHAS